jgi:hypothetical protein
MTSATEVNHESSDELLNGTLGKEPGAIDTFEGEEEESDDYDEEEEADYEEERQIVGDEDDEEQEEEEEGEEDNQGKDTLTHLLLGNPNAPVEVDDVDDEEDEAEDEDDEYAEEGAYTVPASSKKRSIDEVTDEDDSQGSKKVKA